MVNKKITIDKIKKDNNIIKNTKKGVNYTIKGKTK